jgi:hypothetical protein
MARAAGQKPHESRRAQAKLELSQIKEFEALGDYFRGYHDASRNHFRH